MKTIFEQAYFHSDQMVTESTVTHLFTMMHGLNPAVKTMGIVTAENPLWKETSPEKNNKLNAFLCAELKRGAYGFHNIEGNFGMFENPFFIRNITRKDIISLGTRFEQSSVIWGDLHDREHLIYYLINTNPKDPEHPEWKVGDDSAIRHTFVHLDNDVIKDYSEYRGQKFTIPFYEPSYVDYKFLHDVMDGTKIVTADGGMIDKSKLNAKLKERIGSLEAYARKSVDPAYIGYGPRGYLLISNHRMQKEFGVML